MEGVPFRPLNDLVQLLDNVGETTRSVQLSSVLLTLKPYRFEPPITHFTIGGLEHPLEGRTSRYILRLPMGTTLTETQLHLSPTS